MDEKPTIAFLIPAYKNIDVKVWKCHLDFMSRLPLQFRAVVLSSSSCFVHQTRNKLVEMFVKANEREKIDYAFWIDSDILFTANQCKALIEKMQKENLNIATGLYFNMKGKNLVPMAFKYNEERDNYDSVSIEGEKVEVDGAGFGFVCIKGEAMLKMLEEHKKLFRFRESKEGKLIGEDNYFFELAKKSGYKAYLFPKIRVGHSKNLTI